MDVLIIGAGISGLSAARYLLSKDPDLKILVLEAKDRVGGRTFTVDLKTETGTEKWDLGAQWVGGCQRHIMELIQDLGLETHKQYLTGRKYLQIGTNNSVRSYTSNIPTLSILGLLDLDRTMKKIDKLASEVNTEDPYTCSRAKDWDGMTLQSFLQQNMWMSEARELFEVAIRGILGAEPSQISFLFFLTYISSAGGLTKLVEATENTAQEATIKGGTQQISKLIAEKLGESRLHLSEPVKSINQEGDDVIVETELGNTYTAKKVILAIPPSQIDHIRFTPMLPTINRELHRRMPMANYIKVIITYKQAFWRDDGKSGEVVTNGGPSSLSSCGSGPLCLVFDETSHSGYPALVAFLGGHQAVEWRQVQAEEKKSAVLASLAEFFGDKVQDYIDYAEKDWDGEPFCEGAPVCCVGPGAMKYYAEGVRKPLRNVHLAGTESATVWAGYMSGAVQAGHRAAIEVLLGIRNNLVSEQELIDNGKY